jgi:hypothetical protein
LGDLWFDIHYHWGLRNKSILAASGEPVIPAFADALMAFAPENTLLRKHCKYIFLFLFASILTKCGKSGKILMCWTGEPQKRALGEQFAEVWGDTVGRSGRTIGAPIVPQPLLLAILMD